MMRQRVGLPLGLEVHLTNMWQVGRRARAHGDQRRAIDDLGTAGGMRPCV